MALRRHVDIPHVVCKPRGLLDQTYQTVLDAALKDLKIAGRQLTLCLAMHADESQVLQRLYYKGKNQHRTALFWRRLVETRRYCDRLQGMKIPSLVDGLRYSFFSEGSSSK